MDRRRQVFFFSAFALVYLALGCTKSMTSSIIQSTISGWFNTDGNPQGLNNGVQGSETNPVSMNGRLYLMTADSVGGLDTLSFDNQVFAPAWNVVAQNYSPQAPAYVATSLTTSVFNNQTYAFWSEPTSGGTPQIHLAQFDGNLWTSTAATYGNGLQTAPPSCTAGPSICLEMSSTDKSTQVSSVTTNGGVEVVWTEQVGANAALLYSTRFVPGPSPWTLRYAAVPVASPTPSFLNHFSTLSVYDPVVSSLNGSLFLGFSQDTPPIYPNGVGAMALGVYYGFSSPVPAVVFSDSAAHDLNYSFYSFGRWNSVRTGMMAGHVSNSNGRVMSMAFPSNSKSPAVGFVDLSNPNQLDIWGYSIKPEPTPFVYTNPINGADTFALSVDTQNNLYVITSNGFSTSIQTCLFQQAPTVFVVPPYYCIDSSGPWLSPALNWNTLALGVTLSNTPILDPTLIFEPTGNYGYLTFTNGSNHHVQFWVYNIGTGIWTQFFDSSVFVASTLGYPSAAIDPGQNLIYISYYDSTFNYRLYACSTQNPNACALKTSVASGPAAAYAYSFLASDPTTSPNTILWGYVDASYNLQIERVNDSTFMTFTGSHPRFSFAPSFPAAAMDNQGNLTIAYGEGVNFSPPELASSVANELMSVQLLEGNTNAIPAAVGSKQAVLDYYDFAGGNNPNCKGTDQLGYGSQTNPTFTTGWHWLYDGRDDLISGGRQFYGFNRMSLTDATKMTLVPYNGQMVIAWIEKPAAPYSGPGLVHAALSNMQVSTVCNVGSTPLEPNNNAGYLGINYNSAMDAQGPIAVGSFQSQLYMAWSEATTFDGVNYGNYVVRVGVYNNNNRAPSWSFIGSPTLGLDLSSVTEGFWPALLNFNGNFFSFWAEAPLGSSPPGIATSTPIGTLHSAVGH